VPSVVTASQQSVQTLDRKIQIPGELTERFIATRRYTDWLCEPLAVEDFVVQAMPDASPTRWHLAHSTWFFETFVLAAADPAYKPHSPEFAYLFNSYYNTVGEQFPRAQRGLLTRPTVAEVFAYRKAVNESMIDLLTSPVSKELSAVIELGIQHEQQHQELILTDLKYLLSCNPLAPVYRPAPSHESTRAPRPARWKPFLGGLASIGHDGESFHFDNERPRHQVFLQPFELQDRLVTSGEYLEFMQDRGYQRPELWLSLGWATIKQQGWTAPLYWSQKNGEWSEFTLNGVRPLRLHDPATHISYFEADAFARWRDARLPTEAEWEVAAAQSALELNSTETPHFHPASHHDRTGEVAQLFGETWQWTQSPYVPYPGYAPPAGALGEYNGKFMCSQYVLRGGSCATPVGHSRVTYRNFFPPETRWQFSGIRLARDPA
jgi:ergothioneine biosynthesis protein EgtB